MNFILDTDSYKLSHYLGYPPETQHVYSYAESRGGKYPATVFFGLQKFVKELAEVRVTADDVAEAREFARAHGEPFNEEGWLAIVHSNDGRIPVRIRAVPEGTLVPTHNVLVTVENTDPRMPWLTSYIETALLRATWYPTTVATRVHGMKQRIRPFYDATSDSGNMDFALLDFSARGCSSRETASVGGMAHLLSFSGSDNLPAILAARDFYDEPMAAYSVPATEHSVTTAWGREHEAESIEYLLENMLPENGILSLVADTYNVYDYVRKIATFQDRIANKNGTVVIRPDSGNMNEVLYKVFRQVRDSFYTVRNEKNFLVPKRVKVLQGDGVHEDNVTLPFQIAREAGISADAVMAGSGGGLMQANIDRDTCKFAFKASNVTIDGVDIPVAKDPITDPGKRSKAGRMILFHNQNGFDTITASKDPDAYMVYENTDCLRTVYENGELFNAESFSTIRERLSKQ